MKMAKPKKKPSQYRPKKVPENSTPAGTEKTIPPWLIPYQFKPGQSGNPKGPQVGIANEIKRMTGGGMELIHVLVRIMRGERIPGVWGTPTYRDVRDCAVELLERAFGKAPLKINADGEVYDLQRLLYVELSRRKDESGVFDISDEKLLEQGLADQQSVQDPDEKPGRR
jgi:hypothetical protein